MKSQWWCMLLLSSILSQTNCFKCTKWQTFGSLFLFAMFFLLILWCWDLAQFFQKLSEFIQVSNTQFKKKLGFWWVTIFSNLCQNFPNLELKKTATLLNFHVLKVSQKFPTFCHLFCRFVCVCVSQSFSILWF